MNELEILQKQVKLAEESKACAWENNGILERARQKQEATIAELRERHEAFVKHVKLILLMRIDQSEMLSEIESLCDRALCDAELDKEN